MRLLIFLLVEFVLGPFQVLAVIAYTFNVWCYNIRKGISGTAYEPLYSRMIMHQAGTRQDEAAVRLAPYLPALSPAIAALFGSLGLASRWRFAAVEGARWYASNSFRDKLDSPAGENVR